MIKSRRPIVLKDLYCSDNLCIKNGDRLKSEFGDTIDLK